jgi:hypothetical protein
VIQHIVIVKWRTGTTDDEVLEACRKAGHMPNEIDGVERITVGRNRGESEHGFTHALIVQLADEAALAHYLDHPIRKRYLSEHLDPIADQRIEVDVPVDLALEREALASWYWGVGVGMGALPADD